MSVHRAEIGKAHVLKHRRVRQQRLFDACFQVMVKFIQRAPRRVAVECITIGFFEFIVRRLGAQQSQMLAHRADVAVDGHAVVIQNDNERLAGVVQPLVGKAAGKRAVTNEGKHGVVLMLQGSRPRHAERDRDGVGSMSRNKSVMLALVRLRKARKPAVLTQRIETLFPSGQDLMRVALVSHVKHQPVA